MNTTEFKTVLLADIAAMRKAERACSKNDFIFAWPYGLGVKLDGAKASVTSILNATRVWPNTQAAYRVIENGAGERASFVRRQDALQRAIAAQEATLAMLASADPAWVSSINL